MPALREGTAAQQQFLAELLAAGLYLASGVPGLYGRGAGFEAVRSGLNAAVAQIAAPDGAEVMRFPPVMPRTQIEAGTYLKSFPHLAGSIFSFEGDEAHAAAMYETALAHGDWSGDLEQSELVMTPACCYPVYPAVAARGALPPGGVTIDPGDGWVFRHEPSSDPMRLQSFRMREYVRIADPEAVAAWREVWQERMETLFRTLGLDLDVEVASDPFFGRGGRMMARSQRARALKFEITVDLAGEERTAICSFNYHEDHFGKLHGLRTADGEVAHTACLGYGTERVTLALLHTHGLDLAAWPAGVREVLGL